ncbi:hypothetical protein KTQ81_24940 [Salmonella enterica subsp. diarizonae]|nr:hypothetical protein [Salmonella enterica subsp. diarizonae]
MKARNEVLESFSWSVLVAIKMAWRDGRIISELAEHLFIMNWLINDGRLK